MTVQHSVVYFVTGDGVRLNRFCSKADDSYQGTYAKVGGFAQNSLPDDSTIAIIIARIRKES